MLDCIHFQMVWAFSMVKLLLHNADILRKTLLWNDLYPPQGMRILVMNLKRVYYIVKFTFHDIFIGVYGHSTSQRMLLWCHVVDHPLSSSRSKRAFFSASLPVWLTRSTFSLRDSVCLILRVLVFQPALADKHFPRPTTFPMPFFRTISTMVSKRCFVFCFFPH